MTSRPSHEPAAEAGVAYEKRDANSVRLLVLGIGLLVLIGAVLVIIWGLYRFLENRPAETDRHVSTLAQAPVIPPEPRLQSNEIFDMQQLRRRDDSVLTTYGWVDRKAGIARIPVDTALELMSRSHWPVHSASGSANKESSQ
jgi:hypothetical protein